MTQIVEQPINPAIEDQIGCMSSFMAIEGQKVCCRVCYQEMNASQIFQICKCKGSNLYIHRSCLLQWIQRSKAIKTFFGQAYFQCEICKDSIFLELTNKRRVVSVEQMRQKLSEPKVCGYLIAAFLFHLLLILIVVFYEVWCKEEIKEKTVIEVIVLTLFSGISLCLVFLYNSFVEKKTVSINLDERNKKKHKMLMRLAQIIKDGIEPDP